MKNTPPAPTGIALGNAFQDADLFYEQLLDAHHGLTAADSQAFNARLILLMANQIGDTQTLCDCLLAAKVSHR